MNGHLDEARLLDLEQPRSPGDEAEESGLHLADCPACRKSRLECQALRALALESGMEVRRAVRRKALDLARRVELEERLGRQAGRQTARDLLLGRSPKNTAFVPLLLAALLLVVSASAWLWLRLRQPAAEQREASRDGLAFEFSDGKPASETGTAARDAFTPGLNPEEQATERELDEEARRLLISHLNAETKSPLPSPAPSPLPTATLPAATPKPSPTPFAKMLPPPPPATVEADQVDLNRAADVDVEPASLLLERASFRPQRGESASFKLTLPEAAPLEIRIFDALGKSVKLLADGRYGPGPVLLRFTGQNDEGRSLPPGQYYARVMTHWFSRVEPLELLP